MHFQTTDKHHAPSESCRSSSSWPHLQRKLALQFTMFIAETQRKDSLCKPNTSGSFYDQIKLSILNIHNGNTGTWRPTTIEPSPLRPAKGIQTPLSHTSRLQLHSRLHFQSTWDTATCLGDTGRCSSAKDGGTLRQFFQLSLTATFF